jgi:isoquinoline 1-oxidoreductase alpha subunit
MTAYALNINGKAVTVDCDGTTRLLWVLRDILGLTGTKYGCGIAVCWACTVIVDGQTDKSCDLEVKEMVGRKIVTIEGVADTATGKKVQQAWIDEQVPQCGYCQSGMICQATMILNENPKPSAGVAASIPNVCMCGTYQRVGRAILRASGQ